MAGEFRQLLDGDDKNQSGALTINMMVNMFDKVRVKIAIEPTCKKGG